MKVFYTAISLLMLSLGAYADEPSETPQGACVDLAHTDGSFKNLCDKNGKAFLLLEFFSTRCQHCRRNVPLFRTLEQQASAFAHSRLVSLNTYEEAQRFGYEYNLANDIAVDTSRVAAQSYGVQRVPTLFVLNANNQIVFTHIGTLDDAVTQQILNIVRGGLVDTTNPSDEEEPAE